jgi:hypothetical protein
MPRKRLTVAEADALAASLQGVLDQIEEGVLNASPSFRHRLEGALTALAAVRGDTQGVLDRLRDS